MAYTTFAFQPGLIKDDSPLAAEGGYVDADKVRFASGRFQTIGGWDKVTAETYAGVPRGAHAWSDLQGRRYIAFGTAAKLHAIVGAHIRDITPLHSEGVITDPFTTANTESVVTVTHPAHGLSTGTEVTYPNTMPLVGGLLMTGTYPVTVIDEDTYTILSPNNATSTQAAGGGAVDFRAALPAGRVDGIGEPGGYGTGGYGLGGYGTTNAIDFLPRVWFLDSWGETLVALPRGGGLYQWQPAIDYPELVVNGTFDSAAGWTLGAGWSISGGSASAVVGAATNLDRAVPLIAGYVYRVTLTAVVVAGTVSVSTNAGTVGNASSPISRSGEYSRMFRAPPGATRLLLVKDAAFAGSIDNVSVTLESVAYRIDEAPNKNAAMFVDPHQIVVLLGTSTAGGVYNAMAVRWSDRQNIAQWAPATDNLAGDNILAQGSRLVSGIASRQENMIWSDSCAYTMQFTGDSTEPFQFHLSGSGCGLIGALARCEHNGVITWASRDNFYRYTGAAPDPIPCTLRREFFDNLSPNQGEKIVAGILPAYSEVWFFKPDARDGIECSRYAAVRWDEGHWTAGTFDRSAWIKPGIFEHPIAFGTDGKVYYHETGTSAVGGEIDWFIETGYFDIGDGDNIMFLRRIIGDFDDLQGPVYYLVSGRMFPNGVVRSDGPHLHNSLTNKIDLRFSARQMKLKIYGRSSPCFARMGAHRLDLIATGMKR